MRERETDFFWWRSSFFFRPQDSACVNVRVERNFLLLGFGMNLSKLDKKLFCDPSVPLLTFERCNRRPNLSIFPLSELPHCKMEFV